MTWDELRAQIEAMTPEERAATVRFFESYDEPCILPVKLWQAHVTFYGANEVPGRNAAEIPHPLVTDTLARLGALAKSKRIVLVHLNHSNPIADPASPEATVVRASGLEVGQDGMRFAL